MHNAVECRGIVHARDADVRAMLDEIFGNVKVTIDCREQESRALIGAESVHLGAAVKKGTNGVHMSITSGVHQGSQTAVGIAATTSAALRYDGLLLLNR